MRLRAFAIALAVISAGRAMGQAPAVGGLLNNYNHMLPGLPNYGIAQPFTAPGLDAAWAQFQVTYSTLVGYQ